MIKLLLIFLLLVGCGPLSDEGTLKRKTASVKISYSGIKFNDRTSRAISISEDLFPVYHLVSVEPNVDVLLLDNDMTAEVIVPIDTFLWVVYLNWTQEQPNIY